MVYNNTPMCTHIARARVASMYVCVCACHVVHECVHSMWYVVCHMYVMYLYVYICTVCMYECMNVLICMYVHVCTIPEVIYKILYTYLSPVLPQNRP